MYYNIIISLYNKNDISLCLSKWHESEKCTKHMFNEKEGILNECMSEWVHDWVRLDA